MQSLEGGIVGGHGTVVQWNGMHIVLGNIPLGKRNGQLLGPVVPEVDKDHHISLLDQSQGFVFLIHNDDGLYKFISHPLVIRFLKGCQYIRSCPSFSKNQQVISIFDPLPAIVPVHSIKPPHKRGHFSIGGSQVITQVFHIALSTLGIGIPSISKCMYKYILDSILPGHITQLVQVPIQ